MEFRRIVVLGIGNLRCGPTIIGALSTFFGERPIEVVLFDPDDDRLDLFAKFAREAFVFNKTPHALTIVDDPDEFLLDADRVILCLDRNGAFRYLRRLGAGSDALPAHTSAMNEACRRMLEALAPGTPLLNWIDEPVQLPMETYYRIELPPELSEEDRRSMPHQILRWLRGDEWLFDFYKVHEKSKIRAWLEDESAATLVSDV